MLSALRNAARSWVFKALLLLLVLAFAVWGVGDIFRGAGPGATVAEVGGLPIGVGELQREGERAFQRLQQQFGAMERTPELMQGIYRQSLQQLIGERLLEAHARELGITVADETLVRLVREEPAFQGMGGFDRQLFDFFLRTNGLSEEAYLALLRRDILRERLLTALTGTTVASDELTRRIAAWRGEERRGRMLVVRAATMAIGEPDEATLEAFLADHAAEFEAPEYRDLELVLLAPEDLHDEIEPSEAEIEAAYRFHEDRYRTPAERRALQLLAPSRELAATAAALRREGADRAALEAELGGQGLSVSEIGPVTPGSLPAALDAALFALGQGELGEPVESAFGWHVFEVLEARAATVRSLDEVRDELVAELRHEQAIERLPRVADALDDVLAGDPPLAEAAEAVGARHLRLPAVDRDGRDATGAPVTPRLDPEILAAAFTAQVGDVSLLEQTRDGTYYVIALRGITPARTRTLAEARDGIAAAWRRAERAAAARATAERLLERVQAGVTPDSLTGEGVELRELGPVTRSARQPATAAVAALFAAAPGAAPQAVVELPEGAALIWLDEVIPAAPEAVAEQVREELLAARREALILQYERSLRDRYPVSVNERSFAALIER